jgi:hypothetical protein
MERKKFYGFNNEVITQLLFCWNKAYVICSWDWLKECTISRYIVDCYDDVEKRIQVKLKNDPLTDEWKSEIIETVKRFLAC